MANVFAVFNAGSSSLKFSLFALTATGLKAGARGQVEGLYSSPRFASKDAAGRVIGERSWAEGTKLGHEAALWHIVTHLREQLASDRLAGVGHRVAHGGLDFTQPVRVDATVLRRLEAFVPLAPLHQPHNLTPIRQLLERLPDLPQVACFDTAFHRGAPPVSQRFAVPAALHDEGVQRYGFHGLSYEYIASVLARYDERAAGGRTVVLHLGNGASMCALQGGRSVASTMSFTALDGLPMGTRCGTIDPGVILYLLQQRGMSAKAIEELLYKQSGLLGVSGISSDMRVLLESEDPGAGLAIELFVYRIGRELGSLAAALGGLDALVFTGGIGEHAAAIRAAVCSEAAWLGVELDAEANALDRPCISTVTSRVSAWVVPTNEELMIARHTSRLVVGATAQPSEIPP